MGLSTDKLYERYKRIYDSLYTFSLCKGEEIDEVLEFIDTYWRRGHAIVRSKKLLDWQYYNALNNTYNFIVARHKDTGKIHAIEGFIPTTQFDPDIKSAMTWGAIWKAIPDVAPPGLGFVVKQYRERTFYSKYSCEVGVSSDAAKYNKQFGNTIYDLENWYVVNPLCEHYELIGISDETVSDERFNGTSAESKKIDAEQWLKLDCNLPFPEYKSKKYYYNRYFCHPYYQYGAILLRTRDNKEEVAIYRVVSHNKSRAIFFVDYIGDGTVLADSHNALMNLMAEENAEYILFPNFGIGEKNLKAAGFQNSRITCAIIPLYFEPFEKSSVIIKCASKDKNITWCSYKGDADQDRPNIV